MPSNRREMQLIIDSIPALVFLKDTENRVLRVNQPVLDLLGLPREAVEGRHSRELFPADAERYYADDLEVIRSGRAKTGYPEPVGDRWVRTDKIPMPDASGKIRKLLVVATDVTSLKQAEEIEKKANRLLAMTGRITGIGGWEFDLVEQKITWSEQICKLHGVPVGYEPTLDEAISFYTPDSRSVIRELVQRCIENGEPWDVELSIESRTGDEVWVRAIGESERSEGRCVRLWGTLQDITRRRRSSEQLKALNRQLVERAEEAEQARQKAEAAESRLTELVVRLGESEARYRTLFDKSPVMHANVDATDGTIKDCNEVLLARLGYPSKDELIGKPIFSVYSEACHEQVREAFDRFLSTGSVHNEPLLLRTRGGEAIPVMLNVASVRDLNGKVLYSSSTWSDVTELTRANRDLQEFAYIASHDLKAPLRAMDHLVSWLSEDLKGTLPAASEQHLDQLQQRVSRMENLLTDLLAYSKAGARTGQPTPINLRELLESVAEIHSLNKGYAVRFDLEVDRIEAYRVPLELVLRNLVGNAIKHHDRPSGEVRIASRLGAENRVEFSVSDDGPGIPPEMRDRAFRMFQTLKPRDEVEGSGMGLALVKRLVEAEGGRVRIETVEPHGTSVFFTWPLTPTVR